MKERDREYWYESGYSVGYEKGFDTGYAEGCNDTNLENKPDLINLAVTPPEPDAWYAVWHHPFIVIRCFRFFLKRQWLFYEGREIVEDIKDGKLIFSRSGEILNSNLWAVRLNLPEM